MYKYNEYFGEYGGAFVPEPLVPVLKELEEAFIDAMNDDEFLKELAYYQKTYIGRPTPLYFAENITKDLGGANLYFKCEGLAQTGAHKINNALGQCMLAKRMGKTHVVAETGAGQHGVATAAAAAKLGLKCIIFMGATDVKRQRPNVYTMEMFGAEVVSVTKGTSGLADAVDEALGYWIGTYENTHYVLGSAVGPAPFPSMVKEFQSVIGTEVKQQSKEFGLDIEAVVAAIGGGSNAMGIFSAFIDDKSPRLVGVEGGGRGQTKGNHATRLSDGSGAETNVFHGFKSKFLLENDGTPQPTHSISAGLDYPGVGPQLSYLKDIGRIYVTYATNDEVLEALQYTATNEGILFALESAHALVEGIKIAKNTPKGKSVIVHMSGRGDKDIFITAKHYNHDAWVEFLKHELDK